MASIIYNPFLKNVIAGSVSLSHAFKGFLVSSSYSEDRILHERRSDVIGAGGANSPEISGSGYTVGGRTIVVSQSIDNARHEITLTFQSVEWPNSTLSARKLIVYRDTTTTSNQFLVCCIDNGATDRTSNGSTLIWPASSWTIPLPSPIV